MPAKTLDMWFKDLTYRVQRVRSSMKELSLNELSALLEELRHCHFSTADRLFAEQWIIRGRWSTTKLLNVGLELADFFPEAVTFSKEEFSAFKVQLWHEIKRGVMQELEREAARKTTTEQHNTADLKAWIELVQQQFDELCTLREKTTFQERELGLAKSEITFLRTTIDRLQTETQERFEALCEEELQRLRVRLTQKDQELELLRVDIRALQQEREYLYGELADGSRAEQDEDIFSY